MNRRGLLGLLVGAPAAVALGGVGAVRAALGSGGGALRAGVLSVGSSTFISGAMLPASSISASSLSGTLTNADISAMSMDQLSQGAGRYAETSFQSWTQPTALESSETRAIGLRLRLSRASDFLEWDAGVVVRRSGTPLGSPLTYYVEAGKFSLIGIDSAEITWSSEKPEILVGRGDPLVDLENDEDEPSTPVGRWTRINGLTVYLGIEPDDPGEWV